MPSGLNRSRKARSRKAEFQPAWFVPPNFGTKNGALGSLAALGISPTGFRFAHCPQTGSRKLVCSGRRLLSGLILLGLDLATLFEHVHHVLHFLGDLGLFARAAC